MIKPGILDIPILLKHPCLEFGDIESYKVINGIFLENSFIELLQREFTKDEEKLFIIHFICFNAYNDTDFVVNLNSNFKWLGYTRIDDAKRILVKYFEENKDFIIQYNDLKKDTKKSEEPNQEDTKEISEEPSKPKKERKLKNSETIFLTYDCFLLLCLKTKTDQADKILMYYIKLEKVLFQYLNDTEYRLNNKIHH